MKLRVIKILTFLFLLIFFITIGGCFYLMKYKSVKHSQYNLDIINYDKNSDESVEDKRPNYKEVKGITNILLCGADYRPGDKNGRTDSIMIVTIDSNRNKIKVSSIMRDTYVEIKNHGSQKINSAFAYGGIDLLKDTIESNFGMKLDYYAIVNFQGFVDIVDYLDGVEVDVKQNEIKELNKYIGEGINATDLKYIDKPGVQTLNGTQALSYVRIRHNVGGDYARTERQRIVFNKLIDKMKDTSIFNYPKIAKVLWKNVDTNIGFTEALNLAYTIYSMDNMNIETLQIPINELSKGQIYKNKGWVILTDLKQNGRALKSFIYDDKKYTNKDLDLEKAKKALDNYFKE